MKKIAFFHELHKGGARRSSNEFAKRLKQKYKVDLYLVDELQNNAEKSCYSSVNFYKFYTKKWSGGDWKTKLYKDTIELIRLWYLHQKIAKDIDRKQYDLVFIEPSKLTQAPFILRFLKTKKIYYCQEPLRMVYEEIFKIDKNLPFYKYYYEKANRWFRKKIDKSNLKHANLILANSKYTQNNIKKSYGLSSVVQYMGVDTQIFKPARTKKDIDLLFIGAYEKSDGYLLLNQAKKYLATKTNIKILASEKQWITNDKMLKDLYCRSKIAVALAHNEPFGLIPLEAMACAVPVIAVNEGGYKETITNGKTGFLIKRDPKQLADKIQYLLSNPDFRSKFGDNSLSEIKKNWTWDLSATKLEKLFVDIIR